MMPPANALSPIAVVAGHLLQQPIAIAVATPPAAPPSPQQQLTNTLHRYGLLPGTSAATSASTTADGNVVTMSTAALQLIDAHLSLLIPKPNQKVTIPCNYLQLSVEAMRVVREFVPSFQQAAVPLSTKVPEAAHQSHSATAVVQHVVASFGWRTHRVFLAARILTQLCECRRAALSERDVSVLHQLALSVVRVVTTFVEVSGSGNIASTLRTTDVSHPPELLPFLRLLGTLWWLMGAIFSPLDTLAHNNSLINSVQQHAAPGSDSVVGMHAVPTSLQGTATSSLGSSTSGGGGNVVSVYLAALRSMTPEAAWHCSGLTLYLHEAYLMNLGRMMRCLLWDESGMFFKQFDNVTDVVAKLIMERLANRPSLLIPHCTSTRSPTVTHAALYIVHCLVTQLTALRKFPLHLQHKAPALRQSVAAALTAQHASIFHWVAASVLLQEPPVGLTLDPEALIAKASSTDAVTFAPSRGSSSDKAAALQHHRATLIPLLQTIGGICLTHCISATSATLSREVLLTLLSAVSESVLQIPVGQSSPPLTARVHSVDVTKLLHPVVDRCREDGPFFIQVLSKLLTLSAAAYDLVLSMAIGANKSVPAGSKSVDVGGLGHLAALPADLRSHVTLFVAAVTRHFSPFVLLHPLESLEPEKAALQLKVMAYLLPLHSTSLLLSPVPPAADVARKKAREVAVKMRNSMENAITALATRLVGCDTTELLAAAVSMSASRDLLRNAVFAFRLEALLAALRSPILVKKLVETPMAKEPSTELPQWLAQWDHLVVPCMDISHRPQLSLMCMAHDAAIAPVLTKQPSAVIMVPTLVALFCPINGKGRRFQPLPNRVVVQFASKVRLVAENLEQMEPHRWAHSQTPAASGAAELSELQELTPLSAILLLVQGVFDQVKVLHDQLSHQQSDARVIEERLLAFQSALLSLLQLSNPLVTSRVCACSEVLVLDLLKLAPAKQERVLKFAADVIGSTSNYSMKKPLGEWLLRLTQEARTQRTASTATGQPAIRSRL